MFKFTWHAYIYILMIYFLYVSLIYIVACYIYMGVLYLLGCFFVFLVMTNGGGLPLQRRGACGRERGELGRVPRPASGG